METLHCIMLAGELLSAHLPVVFQKRYYFVLIMLGVTMQVPLQPSEHNPSKKC